jgi:hypothetical protein
VFGWLKSVGGIRRTRYRGLARTQLAGYLVGAAYNLVLMARLLAQPVAVSGVINRHRLHFRKPQPFTRPQTPNSVDR